MTHRTDNPRVPDGTEQVTMVRTEPRSDGSTVLVLLTVGPPLTLIEHRMFLDPYLTRALLHTLDRDLDGIEPPGPPPSWTRCAQATGKPSAPPWTATTTASSTCGQTGGTAA
ncbi:hypothetical protein ABT124_40490 [Streptomyces sp. NPDC001982]|uniref:hypothetical protein n=1 Tax=Streptomyces sp. NPDC001982 TaxID=3154405 RepID=UPI003329F214